MTENMTTIRDAVQIAYPADLWLTSADGQAGLPLGEIASELELAEAIQSVEDAGGETIGWHVSGRDRLGQRVSLHDIES
jgi:hypothetical protein